MKRKSKEVSEGMHPVPCQKNFCSEMIDADEGRDGPANPSKTQRFTTWKTKTSDGPGILTKI